jgi:hypothetical protein
MKYQCWIRIIIQSHGSADPDPDPDPDQNVMDPQHCEVGAPLTD